MRLANLMERASLICAKKDLGVASGLSESFGGICARATLILNDARATGSYQWSNFDFGQPLNRNASGDGAP